MTREEAEQACKRLAAEHADRETHRWVPREADDESWEVVKIHLAPNDDEHLTAETRADEKPPTGDDPRSRSDLGPPYRGW
jgi:hypothetical protein